MKISLPAVGICAALMLLLNCEELSARGPGGGNRGGGARSSGGSNRGGGGPSRSSSGPSRSNSGPGRSNNGADRPGGGGSPGGFNPGSFSPTGGLSPNGNFNPGGGVTPGGHFNPGSSVSPGGSGFNTTGTFNTNGNFSTTGHFNPNQNFPSGGFQGGGGFTPGNFPGPRPDSQFSGRDWERENFGANTPYDHGHRYDRHDGGRRDAYAGNRSGGLNDFLNPPNDRTPDRRGVDGRQTDREDRRDNVNPVADNWQRPRDNRAEAHQANTVRENYQHAYRPGHGAVYPYGAAWATGHPRAGHYATWHYNPYARPNWTALGGWVGVNYAAGAGGYSNTVVYEGDTVYVNGQPAGTAEAYAAEAVALANSRDDAPPEKEWMPLGVFAMTDGEEAEAQMLLQLAVAKDGTIQGSYYHTLTDTTQPVQGAVDKETRRTAWTIGSNDRLVFEASLVDLTKDEAPLLLHYADGRTQDWQLVRLPPQAE
ncbi:hypothetical protein [Lignipirellula cremea]|uniref:Uncharacterized protein n=1 Tax=Lignipirellula cremea TaxID=2528010 RepID=A0A518E3P7_9BACT|nr:hypothetical protein [Lignipirellula cremea]QDU98708.1 hypothetical protein Pla8534_65810 [Lignipirellula cremea]